MHFSVKLNLILLVSIIGLSILSISWHHQNYVLHKKINHEAIKNYQIIALNKQLLSERSEVISGAEIKKTALKTLNMKNPKSKDIGKWFKGDIKL